MRRLLIAAICLSLGLVGTAGRASARYDPQVAHEAAGMTTADPAIAVLDPDSDGIACEEGM